MSVATAIFKGIGADNAKDLFRHVFSYGFISNSADPDATLRQLRKLLRIILDATVLMLKKKPMLLNQQLAMLIIRCYVESLDKEWITFEGINSCQPFVAYAHR
jgi:hypothetical protein